VGRWEVGARNNRRDVETVQTLLASAAAHLADAALHPGVADGLIARDSDSSATVRAIEAFQGRFMAAPDGVIEVNRRTWNELVRAGGDHRPTASGDQAGALYFPFSTLPAWDWTTGIRRFGANRSSGRRAHAGCDLYFPQGTWIHAVTEGVVTRGPVYFYNGTYALEVDHGGFVLRYGEVQAITVVREGDRVEAGQPIARVGRLVGVNVPSDMLQLEMFDKSASGALTVTGAASARRADGVPYHRRRDLVDPTASLDGWRARLPGRAI
jgi:murein DD-endopeptidase MepM/ murein hydrolase activator NlpD